ncbi:hypothetical protein CCR83_05275 [Rhodobacter veldkampii DSM 11550]|uniref:Uncharacterized protein n=1 Tax=Phaeovulum veldkampii DSM 11550 TaxID=1185920 RepID=A0A2T4JKK3_9RHOB|nr:hypothetical protein [Phaeovulum veldkampii]MBK5945877.1 hypothetical protein [Phaeovulum veldkampii DSM 11550]PTE18460.1 hypothetical protein C5F46_04720 [Phaeovulum veldkampii DSM 11550]TDQ59344.1 hypothetical protein EV658_108112 [Phaeovulum veldkampii DSM 11550]
MTDQPGTALAVLAQIRAQARAGADALDGLNRAVEALEGIIQEGLEGPFNGVFNALPNAAIRTHQRGKIEQDPELQAFIRARCLTLTFPEVAAQVAANFPPGTPRHNVQYPPLVAPKGQEVASLNRLISAVTRYSRYSSAVVKPSDLLWTD